MGGWRLEVGRMALYITFPVALFHYFNQPELFEEWVIKTKREMYPPENTPEKIEVVNAIKRLKEKQELDRIRALEKNVSD
ncbi:DUF2346 domain containing protein [Asbolus verrucosus]|uniref:DUF2346 domain containing protein n=1 Tax=Asbolus verrucosus TaxID=1661398 RepID=A0A482VNQ0_ASBVE|nr:DUF2346 domain containing protein [Asbolus verrucosus]